MSEIEIAIHTDDGWNLKLLHEPENDTDPFQVVLVSNQLTLGAERQFYQSYMEAREDYIHYLNAAGVHKAPPPLEFEGGTDVNSLYWKYYGKLQASYAGSSVVVDIQNDMRNDPVVIDQAEALFGHARGSGWINAAIRATCKRLMVKSQQETQNALQDVEGFGRF